MHCHFTGASPEPTADVPYILTVRIVLRHSCGHGNVPAYSSNVRRFLVTSLGADVPCPIIDDHGNDGSGLCATLPHDVLCHLFLVLSLTSNFSLFVCLFVDEAEADLPRAQETVRPVP